MILIQIIIQFVLENYEVVSLLFWKQNKNLEDL